MNDETRKTTEVCKRCGKPKLDWQVYCGAACSAQRNIPVPEVLK